MMSRFHWISCVSGREQQSSREDTTMTNSTIHAISAVAALAAAAGKLLAQKCARTGGRGLQLGLVAALVTICNAPDARAQSGVTMSDLLFAQLWKVAIVGNTGCGQTSLLFTEDSGTLNASGDATFNGMLTGSSGCGSSSSLQTFTVTSLNPNGSGTATLTCGPGCGWNFDIQVTNNWTFNLVDVADGGNALAGTAIAYSSSPNNSPLALLAGPWQITLVGNTGCGPSSLLFSGSLNTSGTATGTLTASSGCGKGSSPQTFTITDWNSVTVSGTATLSCGSGCGWTFAIQLDSDASSFNLVDVANGGNELAGTAIRVEELGVSRLTVPWQIALVGNTSCGRTSMLFTGALNASGTATGTLTASSGCGKSSSPQTFKITSLQSNGSGTATLSCGPGCLAWNFRGGNGWTFDIQVGLLALTFDLVDVANGGNELAGTAMASFVPFP
jgi:hypothetical protein